MLFQLLILFHDRLRLHNANRAFSSVLLLTQAFFDITFFDCILVLILMGLEAATCRLFAVHQLGFVAANLLL